MLQPTTFMRKITECGIPFEKFDLNKTMINQNETAKRYIALSEFKLLKLIEIAVIFSIYTFLTRCW